MNQHFIIRPYKLGANRKSLGMILPSKVVKFLEIDSISIYLLLKVKGKNDLQIKIIREEDLMEKEETEKARPVPAGISL
jgi:hypothetical protein